MIRGSDDFDVAVAGGGYTGATLALALSQSGLKTALVDPEPALEAETAVSDERAYAISSTSLAQWRALGVADALTAGAQPITAIAISDARHPSASRGGGLTGLLQFDLADLAADGEPLGLMVSQTRIRGVLEAALSASSAQVFRGERAVGLTVASDAATVTLSSGRALRAALVVGAEGRGSFIRRAAGIRTFGWPYDQSGLVATVALEKDYGGVAHEIFLPTGPLAVLPLTGGRASLVWTERTDAAMRLRSLPAAAFEAILNRRLGEGLGRARLVSERRVFPLALQIAERLTAPRVALVGDAGHAIHPIAGQGLNMGLKDVAALAEVVVNAARLGEDVGSELTLLRYARWRRFDAAALAAATDLFTRLFSTDLPAARLARGVGLGLVGAAPMLRRFFVREASGAQGILPALLRGAAP